MAKSVLQQRLLFLFLTAIAIASPIIVIGAVSKEEMTLGWGIWTVVIVPTVIWALYIKDQMRFRPIKGWETYILAGGMILQISSLLFIEERLRSIVFFAMLIEWLTFLLKARQFGRQNIDTIMFYATIGMISSSFTTVVFEFTTGLNLIYLSLPANSIYFYVFITIMGANVFRNYLDVVSLNTLLLNRSEKGEQAVQENQWFAATFGLVSHNMKTPLANALGQLEITRLRARTIEGADQLTKGLNQIEESICTTKNTLEETIQLYKNQINHSQRGQLQLSDLEEPIKRFSPEIKVEYRNSAQHQTIHGSTYFVLHRYLETAVDNALKYSGSVPTVVFTNTQVIVQDFGPGFSDTEISTLGKGIVKSCKGSGLGLYFTNSLLGTINWEMKIENNSKGGCLVASKLLSQT